MKKTTTNTRKKPKKSRKIADPYAYADRQLKTLQRASGQAFTNALNRLSIDELNIIPARKEINRLYEELEALNEAVYSRIIAEAYFQAHGLARVYGYQDEQADDRLPRKKRKELALLILSALLSAGNPVTEYRYTSEVKRKSQRLLEAVISRPDSLSIKASFEKAMKSWWLQTAQYADLSVDAAWTQAFKDSGVSEVEWITEQDARVCRTCRERDGQRYRADAVPPKPHYRCRCHVEPIVREDTKTQNVREDDKTQNENRSEKT